MSNLAAEVAEDIKSALANDQLELPSLPEVALQVRDVAESEDVSAISLSAVVGKDPGLAAQLVRVANSPMFRATRSIDDVTQAVSRLGVNYSCNIVTGLAMQQMFQATSEFVDRKLREVWSNATTVAAWSSVLAKRYTKLRPDQATLAGLTHSIGMLPILGWVEENDHLVKDSMTLDKVIEAVHPSIGTMILQHWNFAEEIIAVPEGYMQIARKAEAPDYIDLVLMANLFSLRNSNHPLIETDWQSADAFARIGLDPNMDELDMASLEADVDEVTRAFH